MDHLLNNDTFQFLLVAYLVASIFGTIIYIVNQWRGFNVIGEFRKQTEDSKQELNDTIKRLVHDANNTLKEKLVQLKDTHNNFVEEHGNRTHEIDVRLNAVEKTES